MNINFIRPPADKSEKTHALKLVVQPGDVLCLYLNGHRLHVISGSALITWEGQEYTLTNDEDAPFTTGKAPAVISATGGGELTLEVESL